MLEIVEHLFGFSNWPVQFWKRFIALLIDLASSTVALKNKRLSSANSKFEIPGAFLATFRGVMFFFSVSALREQDRASPTNRKR